MAQVRLNNELCRKVEKMELHLSLSFAQREWLTKQNVKWAEENFKKNNGKTTRNNISYYCILQTYKGWQIVRHVAVCGDYFQRKGYKLRWIDNPCTHWLKGGEHVCFQHPKKMFWYNCAYEYALGGSYIRKYVKWDLDHFYTDRENIYPRMSVTEQFKYCKEMLYSYDINRIHLAFLAQTKTPMQSWSHLETLHKSYGVECVRELLYTLCRRNETAGYMNKHWNTFMIARKNGYNPFDKFADYIDYLKMANELKLDLTSPKYLAPTDEIHTSVINQVARKRAEEDLKRKLKDSQADEKAYGERMAKWTDLCIASPKSGVYIYPLMTVKSVAEEGQAMHHCVFAARYYRTTTSLLLSARDSKGKRIETIELSIKDYKVLQSRGVCNKPTDKHETILRMLKKNMPLIKSINEPSKYAKAVTA